MRIETLFDVGDRVICKSTEKEFVLREIIVLVYQGGSKVYTTYKIYNIEDLGDWISISEEYLNGEYIKHESD